MRSFIPTLVIAVAFQFGPAASQAVEMMSPDQAIVDSGRVQYQGHCAKCHGSDATGAEISVKGETIKTPDLTTLAKKGGGALPLWDVYEVVSGSKVVAEHRTRTMPIWSEELAKARGITTENKEAIVRGRIFAILAYLSTLQAK